MQFEDHIEKILEDRFKSLFNKEYDKKYFSPGRINLIGEHIDYSGGFVLPCAITMGTTALMGRNEDNKLRFYSENMRDLGVLEFGFNQLDYREDDGWTNYIKGIFKVLKIHDLESKFGLDIVFYGSIPYASGLSSSASILMATAFIVNDVYNLGLSPLELVKLTKDVENNYIGVKTGIMDQFSIGFGKSDHALLLDTNTLDYEYIPLELEDNSIVIMNTNKKRGLADSAYNDRKQQCDLAYNILKKEFDIEYLCNLNLEQLESKKDLLSSEEMYRRARHAISENLRTIEASEELKKGNLDRFGELMKDSHISLRDDYEVTGIELDTLFETAKDLDGCLGVRVTGAGFGGCAIAIVNNKYLDDFIKTVKDAYFKTIGYDADFYVAKVGNGTQEV